MQYKALVYDSNTFSELERECNAIFDTKSRLPKQVFRQKFDYYYAFEHGLILNIGFASVLTMIAQCFEDKYVNYMSLTPDPVDFYHKLCGFYGVASFESKNLILDYLEVMRRGGKTADSFAARGGDVGVIWGSSLAWGICCDRISWELCVIGTSRKLDEAVLSKLRCMDMEKVKSYISAAYHWKPAVAVEFLDEFAINYSL